MKIQSPPQNLLSFLSILFELLGNVLSEINKANLKLFQWCLSHELNSYFKASIWMFKIICWIIVISPKIQFKKQCRIIAVIFIYAYFCIEFWISWYGKLDSKSCKKQHEVELVTKIEELSPKTLGSVKKSSCMQFPVF